MSNDERDRAIADLAARVQALEFKLAIEKVISQPSTPIPEPVEGSDVRDKKA